MNFAGYIFEIRGRGNGVVRRRSNLEDVFVKLTGEYIEREEYSETEEKIQ